jgi:hypothetical protein
MLISGKDFLIASTMKPNYAFTVSKLVQLLAGRSQNRCLSILWSQYRGSDKSVSLLVFASNFINYKGCYYFVR